MGIGTATPTGAVTIIGAYSSGTAAPLVVQNTTPYGGPGYNQYVQIWLNSSGSVMGSIRNNGEFAFSNTISTSYFRAGAAGSASTPIYGGSGSNGIFFPAANTMAFTTNAVEALRIFSTRNIAIGTATDAGFKLDVNGTARVQNDLTITDTFKIVSSVNANSKVTFGSNLALQGQSGILLQGGHYITLNGVVFGATSVNASAVLQADSTNRGFLPPRMTTTQKNAIASPAAGLVVYDTTLNKLCVYTSAWETITSV